MREVSSFITYKGKDYKIVFNLNVMESIQSEYGTIDKWGDLTEGKGGETDVKALIYGLREMLNEGIDIENEENGTNTPMFTHKQVGRILSEVGIKTTSEAVKDLVVDSVKTEHDEKNV